MKTELVQIVFFTFALVFAAAAQEMTPSFGGAKPPFLLLVALAAAMRPDPVPPSNAVRHAKERHHFGWLAVALAAGAFADALDELPFCCMAVFAVFACASARLAREAVRPLPGMLAGFVIGALAAPCQEAWLNLWMPSSSAPAMVRFFASVPAAAAAGAVLFHFAPRIAHAIGLDGVQPTSERNART